MNKSIRHMDIAFGDVVSIPAWSCIEFGYNPDVEELERYNLQAKQTACPHDNRRRVDYWICTDCRATSGVPWPTATDGEFTRHGTIWKRRKEEQGG